MLAIFVNIAVLVLLTAIFVWGWNRKFCGTKWAVRLRGADCPRCGNHLPAIRIPRNRQQRQWGGWTCSKCGCEVDKFGKEIVAGVE